ncbi:hypothetical protein [Staphylococcus xylosus]|uniref:hypothetical protein n=1 Tax=Staphylococcus xylosus TaxID=1288 RepID=UPI000345E778|nr:hypothetical protein [Staphylococcus xylosus]
MKKFVSKSILGSMSAAALLMVASPAIDAAEQSTENPAETNLQTNEQNAPKEVTTYEDFKNAEGPVSINPNSLTDEELKKLDLNPQEIRSEFGEKTTYSAEATQKWSGKVTKGQLANTAVTIGGVTTIISGILSLGSGATITSGAFTVISQIIRGGNFKGVKVGGTKTKRLVRENPYQKPVKKWVYKITWAKPY